MKLCDGDFVPLILRSALEPGASVAMPEAIVRHCISNGFSAGCFAEPGRLLAAARVIGPECQNKAEEKADGKQRKGTKQKVDGKAGNRIKKRGPFRLLAGSDLEVRVQDYLLSCVCIARTVEGWEWLRRLCTRPVEEDGPINLKLNELNSVGKNIILLVKVGSKIIPRHILKALQRVVPNSFLALGAPDREQVRSGKESGVLPVAAPDIVCIHQSEERILALSRELRGLQPVDSTRCMTLGSRRAVIERFRGAPKLIRQTRKILDSIDCFPLEGPPNLSPEAASNLRKDAYECLSRKDLPPNSREMYERRLDQELRAIARAGLEAQFTMARGLLEHAHTLGIPRARGCGVTTNLLTAWTFGLTAINPVVGGLPFELYFQENVPQQGHSTPLLSMGMGRGAEGMLVEHLKHGLVGLVWSYTWTLPEADACIDRLAHLRTYSPGRLATLRKRLHDRLNNLSPTNRRPKGSFPLRELEPEVSALAAICTLPWKLSVHRGGVLFEPSLQKKTPNHVAPVEWNAARNLGLLAVEIAIDDRLDDFVARAEALPSEYIPELLARLNCDSDPNLLGRAFREWDRKQGIAKGSVLGHIQRHSGHAPRTFADLVVLHAFSRDPTSSLDEVAQHFREGCRMEHSPMRHHPVLREILLPTRGKVVFVDEAVEILRRVFFRAPLNLEPLPQKVQVQDYPTDVREPYLWERLRDGNPQASNARPEESTSPKMPEAPTPEWEVRWLNWRRVLARRGHVAVQNERPSLGRKGVLGLRSIERKRLYRRCPDQNPPSLSYRLADRLALMVRSALKRNRLKSGATLDAINTYANAVFASIEEMVRRERSEGGEDDSGAPHAGKPQTSEKSGGGHHD